MVTCQAAAALPATGPSALKPRAPKMRGAAREVAARATAVIFRPVNKWGWAVMKLVVECIALRNLVRGGC